MKGSDARDSRIIRCPACKRYYRMTAGAPAAGTRLRCTKCGEVFVFESPPAAAPVAPVPHPPLGAAPAAARPPRVVPAPAAPAAPARHAAPRGRILVATDGDEFQALIGEVLAEAGFELLACRSGHEAWEQIGAWQPHVALLDVALPLLPAFEICDRVRSDDRLRGLGLILIASVFQQTRYKRAPTSLYGADDYIEKHHIRDRLPGKIERLLPAAPPATAQGKRPAAGQLFIGDREKENLIREEVFGPRDRQRQGLERLRENLRRYARIIVSDIALYNQELVERGIREGTFTELLAGELEEGRKLYLTRVPPGGASTEHYEEAVRDFIAARSAGRRIGPQPGRRGHGRS